MCLQTRVFKNENTTKKYQKMVAQDLSIYGMMFRKRSHVSTKFTQMTYVKSSDLIKPPEEFFQKHLQQIPPSLRLAVIKMQVIETTPTSAEAVECCGAFCRHGGRWHWGCGCRGRRRQRRTFHRPRRSRPMCGRSALRAPFRSGTADSSDWPGESGPSRELTWNGCAKSNHNSGSTKNSCPLARNVFPTSAPPLRH